MPAKAVVMAVKLAAARLLAPQRGLYDAIAMAEWKCTTDWEFESELWHGVRPPRELHELARDLDTTRDGSWARVCEFLKETRKPIPVHMYTARANEFLGN